MNPSEFRKQAMYPDAKDTQLLSRLNESDIGTAKRVIKQKLIQSRDIRTLLDDEDLKDTDDYSDYLYHNIFPFLQIPNIITDKKNYILFKVDDADDNYYGDVRKTNPLMKVTQVQFMILVYRDNVKTEYGVDRHDALAYVIRQLFSYSEKVFPFKLRCISDVEGVTDNNFATRTITFESEYTNNLYETRRRNAYEGKSYDEPTE